VPGSGRRPGIGGGAGRTLVCAPAVTAGCLGMVIRRSASRASSAARVRARSDKVPSVRDWMRQARRLKRKSLFPERDGSPNTSKYLFRSSAGTIRRCAAISAGAL
jgi:hypothetical protein